MNIGKLVIGKRLHGTQKFRVFYCPILKTLRKEYFWFFWWFGHNWYICLPKKNTSEETDASMNN